MMNKKMPFFVFMGALLSGQVVASASQQKLDNYLAMSIEQLMDMEVLISTASMRPLSKAPAVVSVITERDIEATGATNLVDVLEGVPGIHVRYSQFAMRPLVQFRGASAGQTLLMINGNSVRDLMWGFGVFWKGIPASAIDRIEIIRGPGSALFGADASAGVINVITKTAGKIDSSEVGVRVGSFDTRTAWVQHGSTHGGMELGLTAEFSTTDGHEPFIVKDAQAAGDPSYAPGMAETGWDNVDLRMSLAWEDWKLLYGFTKHIDLEVGLTGFGVLDPQTRASDHRHTLDFLYRNDDYADNWGLDLKVGFQQLAYSSGIGFFENPPGSFAGAYPDGVVNQMRASERSAEAEVSGVFTGIENHALRMGVGYRWQDLYHVEHVINKGTGPTGTPLPLGSPLVDVSDTPYAFAPEKTRHIVFAYVQDVWSIQDGVELIAGVRFDHYSDFGNTVNPRLALVWEATDKLTAKVMYGHAFQAPSFQQLFAETSFSLPNSSLEPETSTTIELQLGYALNSRIQLGMNIFHYEQEDVIRPVTPIVVGGGVTKRRYENVGEHAISGVELEAWWQASPKVRFSGNYTYRDPEDNDYRAFDEPKQEAYLRADWGFRPGWNLNLQSNWIGKRYRPDTDSRPDLGSHTVTDVTLRYSGLKNLELAASVRNLFDVDAHEYTSARVPNDLPLPGRNGYLELRYQF